MTRTVFQKWLIDLNAGMREQERHVLLLVDNTPSHNLDWKRLSSVLGNGRVHFLPKNTTARLQPLDASIIGPHKRYYRQRSMAQACRPDELGCSDPYTLDLRQAMTMIKAAWGDVRQETWCWRHCNIVHRIAKEPSSELDIWSTSFRSMIHQTLSIDKLYLIKNTVYVLFGDTTRWC